MTMTNTPARRVPTLPVSPMTAFQAKSTLAQIRDSVEAVRSMLLDFHDRNGWEALGYKSFNSCVEQELGWKKSYAGDMLKFVQVKHLLTNSAFAESSPEVLDISEPVVRVTRGLPVEQAAEVITQTAERTGGKVTPESVRETMDSLPRPKKKPKKPKPRKPKGMDEWMRKTVSDLKSLQKDIERTANGKGGPWISPLDKIVNALEYVRQRIESVKYGSLCGKCRGQGCKDCRETGWWPKWRKDEMEG